VIFVGRSEVRGIVECQNLWEGGRSLFVIEIFLWWVVQIAGELSFRDIARVLKPLTAQKKLAVERQVQVVSLI